MAIDLPLSFGRRRCPGRTDKLQVYSARKGSIMRMAGTVMRVSGAISLALTGIKADAVQFVRPAGFSGKADMPGVATPAEPGAPALTRMTDAKLSKLFHVNPGYSRAAAAHAKVVGAFTIAEPTHTHFVAAWASGFLPVTLSFSDGRCFSLTAQYTGGMLSNGGLRRTDCDPRPGGYSSPTPTPPAQTLRLIGSAWGYGAWSDDRVPARTIVSAPHDKIFEPLFTADMRTSAIMAMNGPDWPGGNITLVGRWKGRLTVVTLEVSY